MPASKRSEYEIRKLADWWLDISKLIFASFALKLFEPGGPKLTYRSIIAFLDGLIFSLTFAKIGLRTARKIHK